MEHCRPEHIEQAAQDHALHEQHGQSRGMQLPVLSSIPRRIRPVCREGGSYREGVVIRTVLVIEACAQRRQRQRRMEARIISQNILPI